MGFMFPPGQLRSLCQEGNPSSVATGSEWLAWGHRTHKGWCRRVCSLPQYF